MSDNPSGQCHRGHPKDRANLASDVLAETAEHWASEIEPVALGLLQAAALTDSTARGNGDSERRLRRAAGRLGTKLHTHLAAARDWERAVSANGLADDAHLRPAIETLAEAVERASVLLLQADILLATPDRAPMRSLPADDGSSQSRRGKTSRRSRLSSLPDWNRHLTDGRSGARALPSTTDDPASPQRYARAA